MMKTLKIAALAVVLVCGAMMTTSCGTPFPLGCLYTNVWTPGALGDGNMYQNHNRIGYSSCYSFLGWFAGGSATHNLAAKQGQINKIAWTSWHIENYLGIFGRFTNVVYGIGDKADPTIKHRADFD